MAAGDYNVADRPNAGLTAGEKIGEVTVDPANNVDAVAAAAADTAGVRSAAFIGYAAALDAHAARVDIEDLDSKNRRDMPATFASADHMRLEPSDDAPTPGSVNGVAPDATAGP